MAKYKTHFLLLLCWLSLFGWSVLINCSMSTTNPEIPFVQEEKKPNDAGSFQRNPDQTLDSSMPSESLQTEKDASPSQQTVAGKNVILKAFQGEYLHFTQENRRTIRKKITFPERKLSYKKITLRFALRCPKIGGCDFWDRFGYLAIITNPSEEKKNEKIIEIIRFITPYRVEASWEIDVTSLRPLLAREVTLQLFIDTWVGPGHANGAGWLVDASFELKGGENPDIPKEIIPLWSLKKAEYGHPKKPLSSSIEPIAFMAPTWLKRLKLRSFITGHGQGNADNCAEFCPRDHFMSINEFTLKKKIWRNDCDQNLINNQAGSWRYPRAGWCPGDYVQPWVEDISETINLENEQTISYDVESYENTCRPDAAICKGCLRNGCEYNNNGHTRPFYAVSAALLLFDK